MMRICGSKAPIDESWGDWHSWFAWRPISFFEGDDKYCVWFRHVYRRTKKIRGSIYPENTYIVHDYRLINHSKV